MRLGCSGIQLTPDYNIWLQTSWTNPKSVPTPQPSCEQPCTFVFKQGAKVISHISVVTNTAEKNLKRASNPWCISYFLQDFCPKWWNCGWFWSITMKCPAQAHPAAAAGITKPPKQLLPCPVGMSLLHVQLHNQLQVKANSTKIIEMFHTGSFECVF